MTKVIRIQLEYEHFLWSLQLTLTDVRTDPSCGVDGAIVRLWF